MHTLLYARELVGKLGGGCECGVLRGIENPHTCLFRRGNPEERGIASSTLCHRSYRPHPPQSEDLHAMPGQSLSSFRKPQGL